MSEDNEFWLWWITSETSGKRVRSSWRMNAETAKAYPGAERVPGTLEVRPPGRARDAALAPSPPPVKR